MRTDIPYLEIVLNDTELLAVDVEGGGVYILERHSIDPLNEVDDRTEFEGEYARERLFSTIESLIALNCANGRIHG